MANVLEFSIVGNDKFSGAMSKLKSVLGTIIKTVVKAAAAIVAAGAATLALVKKFASMADAVGKFASRLGVATDALSSYQFVANLSGISTEQFNMAIQRATRRVAEAAKGFGEGASALRELGIDAREFNQLGLDERLVVLADRMEGVTSKSDKLRIAFKLFDSEGTAMLQMLNQGSDRMREMAADADFLGVKLGAQATANAAKFNDEMTRAGKAIQGVGHSISQTLMPILTPMVKAFADGLASSRDAIVKFVEGAVLNFFTLVDVLKQVWKTIKELFSLNTDELKNFFEASKNLSKNLGVIFLAAGRAIFIGIWEGIKLAGNVVKDFAGWAWDAIKKGLTGGDVKSFGETMAESISTHFEAAKEKMAETLDEMLETTKFAASAAGQAILDGYGINWDKSRQKAQAYIDKMREAGTATVESVEEQQEAFEPFYETLREKANEFLTSHRSATQEIAETTFDLMMSTADQIGGAFASAIIEGKNLGDALKNITKQVMAGLIQMLIKIGLQRLVLASITASTTAQQASTEASRYVAGAAAGGLASMAAAPFPINLTAPAFSAAMAAAAAGAYTSGAAAGKALGASVVAHGGMSNVPKETTYFLDKGERVVSPRQNKDLTDFLSSGGRQGSSVTIQNLNVEVLPNATNAQALLDMDKVQLEEVVAGPIINALNKLDKKGIRPVFAERGKK